jgi:hypothetical protein
LPDELILPVSKPVLLTFRSPAEVTFPVMPVGLALFSVLTFVPSVAAKVISPVTAPVAVKASVNVPPPPSAAAVPPAVAVIVPSLLIALAVPTESRGLEVPPPTTVAFCRIVDAGGIPVGCSRRANNCQTVGAWQTVC